jgi:ABC-type phosphate transport system permease subunit|tara:strand:+ start:1431 stop:1625 length:195 start_codon:yes stop_codon:yes gene_type:complete
MERGLMMLLHAVLIGVLLYLLMVYLLKQSPKIAEDRSVLLGALVLAYMVLFGHGLPTKMNKNIM